MKILKINFIFIIIPLVLSAQKVQVKDSISTISLNEVNVEGIRVSTDHQ